MIDFCYLSRNYSVYLPLLEIVTATCIILLIIFCPADFSSVQMEGNMNGSSNFSVNML